MISLILGLLLLAIIFHQRAVYFENLLLRAQLAVLSRRSGERRLRLTENLRRLFVWIARFWDGWESSAILVKPVTVLDWMDRRYKDYWTFITNRRPRSGRPPVSDEIQSLIKRFSLENIAWTPARIRGEVYQLTGARLHLNTIRKYMAAKPRDPRNILRWKTFLKLHCPTIAAMDFFTMPRVGTTPLFGFFVISHERRQLLHINVTGNPTARWLKDQLMLAFPPDLLPENRSTLNVNSACTNRPFRAGGRHEQEEETQRGTDSRDPERG